MESMTRARSALDGAVVPQGSRQGSADTLFPLPTPSSSSSSSSSSSTNRAVAAAIELSSRRSFVDDDEDIAVGNCVGDDSGD